MEIFTFTSRPKMPNPRKSDCLQECCSSISGTSVTPVGFRGGVELIQSSWTGKNSACRKLISAQWPKFNTLERGSIHESCTGSGVQTMAKDPFGAQCCSFIISLWHITKLTNDTVCVICLH